MSNDDKKVFFGLFIAIIITALYYANLETNTYPDRVVCRGDYVCE